MWDYQPKNEGTKGESKFIKLQDGESVTGVIRGEKKEYHVVWDKVNKRSVTVEPYTDGAKFRFKTNFVMKDGLAPKILEQGWMVYSAIKDLHKAGYDMQNTWVRISRSGKGLDTSYTVLPMPEFKLSESEKQAVEALVLNDLPVDPPANKEPEHQVNEDIPF